MIDPDAQEKADLDLVIAAAMGAALTREWADVTARLAVYDAAFRLCPATAKRTIEMLKEMGIDYQIPKGVN